MRFASLGSGSRGNALVVEVKQTRLLLDCGFGLRETVARLLRLDLQPEDLAGILITHEHTDHIGGAVKFARRFALPVWLTHGTFTHHALAQTLPDIRLIDGHSAFQADEIEVQPFPVPHDAREPVQYAFSSGSRRLGVLTDTGVSTPHIEAILSGCDALVLECNHDPDMLRDGPYPPMLKQRVAGRFGHLDNGMAARLLASLDNSKLQHLIAAHLSEKNNTPELARAALSGVLNCDPEWIGVADQRNGFGWRQIL
ncbi:MAG: MBL fold metallo-hydrolase [Hydrogenophilales bacterium CG_4_9_14_3_um_filter_59_35]|nr:MAG: MBL fold metallo-hydrolase [Hydrogenophilales bacterium CG18_big_fil_WC_8_21_14_2_50_58_12]PIY01838.1 MAG: MBL fold metallo-hydrolase [Hydrogenophilales bacterium CG_4_10_14_3_um_filter_58_23]PJB08686.1 MAG: MBL fold metallo-hydrolase [Hydrogenophilales bacterium CG_4_9_14_3_um_filter_59_35]